MAKLFKKKDSANSGKSAAIVGKNSSKFKLPKIFKETKKTAQITGAQMGQGGLSNKLGAPASKQIPKATSNPVITKKRYILGLVVALIIASISGYFYTRHNKIAEEPTVLPFEFAGEAAVVTSKAYDLVQEKEIKQAIKTIDEYINSGSQKSSKDLSHLYSAKAAIQQQFGMNKEALESTLKSIEVYPNDPRNYSQAAWLFVLNGNTDTAREYYQKALKVYDQGLPEGYAGPPRDYFVQRTLN